MEKDIAALEQEEMELIQTSILKLELLKLFADYKSSRKNIVTLLFRNKKLTAEKLRLVEDTINLIKDYEGTKEKFIEELRRKRVENAEKSRTNGKFHFNLLAPHLQKTEYGDDLNGTAKTRIKKIVRAGESTRSSNLASLFHNAIDMATTRITAPTIKNRLK